MHEGRPRWTKLLEAKWEICQERRILRNADAAIELEIRRKLGENWPPEDRVHGVSKVRRRRDQREDKRQVLVARVIGRLVTTISSAVVSFCSGII